MAKNSWKLTKYEIGTREYVFDIYAYFSKKYPTKIKDPAKHPVFEIQKVKHYS